MMAINQVIITGNLGNDPETFYSGDGLPIASFSLAFNSNSSKKEKTNWIKVVCFNRLAEVVTEWLAKGSKITVSGSLTQDTWEADDGTKKSAHKILANSLEFIRTKKDKEEEPF